MFPLFQKVGCDYKLGSDVQLDLCGVCGGNNSCLTGTQSHKERYQWREAGLSQCSASCGVGNLPFPYIFTCLLYFFAFISIVFLDIQGVSVDNVLVTVVTIVPGALVCGEDNERRAGLRHLTWEPKVECSRSARASDWEVISAFPALNGRPIYLVNVKCGERRFCDPTFPSSPQTFFRFV